MMAWLESPACVAEVGRNRAKRHGASCSLAFAHVQHPKTELRQMPAPIRREAKAVLLRCSAVRSKATRAH